MRLEEHGITIGGYHTYTHLGLVAQEIPVFQPPAPKVQKIDVPGSSGEIDLTDSLTGAAAYGNRKGKIKFVCVHPSGYAAAYALALSRIHGKRLRAVLDDDTAHYYEGRWTVEQWQSLTGASLLVIGYDLLPYKFPAPTPLSGLWTGDTTILFETVFDITGTSTRYLINPTQDSIRPVITASTTGLSVQANGGSSISLSIGDNTPIVLSSGSNTVVFTGTGRIGVRYYPSKSL